jgi:hypothetical protein
VGRSVADAPTKARRRARRPAAAGRGRNLGSSAAPVRALDALSAAPGKYRATQPHCSHPKGSLPTAHALETQGAVESGQARAGIDAEEVNRGLLQPHWRKEVDLPHRAASPTARSDNGQR